jgi:mannose/fructose/N-acetylgalactosamine-specific phosphotransferase system component IIB
MGYRLDDADLALIEINNPTPLVQSLVEEVRRLRDANVAYQVQAEGREDLEEEVSILRDEVDDLQRQLARVGVDA